MEYQALLDDIVSGQCLPVIGAGFSKNVKLSNGSEMPDWEQLANTIKQQFNTTKTEPMEILQEFVDEFDRSRLIRELDRIIPTNGVILGDVHKYFVKLPFDLIYTTNFDLLLEDAFKQESKRNWKPLVGEKSFSGYASPPTVNIIKMHGDLHHVDHLVVTKKDYDEYLTKYAIIATHLSASLITKTPLFIGYSLTDPNFRHIWEIVHNRLGEFARRGFIIQFNATLQDVEEYKKYHLSVINLKLNGRTRSETLFEFLKEICTYATTYNLKKEIQSNMETSDTVEKVIHTESSPPSPSSFTNAREAEAIKSIGLAEQDLREVLEKSGVSKKELKISLTRLSDKAFQFGLLSSSDLGLIRDIMAIRNQVVHSGKDMADEQVKWIINSIDEIRKKISSINIGTSGNVSVKVSVDSKNYTDGNLITITGKVKPVIKNLPLTFMILAPDGTLVQVMQSDVDESGRSISVTKAIGALWEDDGTYIVRAQYGVATATAEDKFEFKHRISRVSGIFPVDYNNKFFEVSYNIRGGILRDIELDPYSLSLRILIESNQDGDVMVDIPRNLIDATAYDEGDNAFQVTIDGTEVNYIESKTAHSRILTIRFLKGDYAIDILGSRLPPLERVIVTNLRVLDTENNPIAEIVPDKPILITTHLTNNQNRTQKYTLVVQILKDGITIDNLWVDGVMSAHMSSEPSIVWIPIDSGEFDLQVFVWETIENPQALSPPQHLRIKVVKGQNVLQKPIQSVNKITSDLDTLIETSSQMSPNRNQLNDAIKLYDICWQWAKENITSKYEINILKINPVSFVKLLAVPDPSRELKATKDELVIKAKRLKKIIVQEFLK